MATTFYDDGKTKKTVVHDPICNANGTDSEKVQARAMSKLEDELDRITRSVKWVGTQAERDALRNAGSWIVRDVLIRWAGDPALWLDARRRARRGL